MKNVRMTIFLVAAAVVVMAVSVQAAFILENYDYLKVDTSYTNGALYDHSTADVVQGGFIKNVYINDGTTLNVLEYRYGTSGRNIESAYAYNNSSLNLLNGEMFYIRAYDFSTANMSGGSVSSLQAYDSSTVNISGGSVNSLYAWDISTVNISGGSVADMLYACDSSTVIFDGYGFVLTNGLSWDTDGKTILGTGTLIGKWDDTIFADFAISIIEHDITATIMAVPEPATLLLLGLGGLVLRKRK